MEVNVSSKMMNITNYTCTVLAHICLIDPFPLLRSDLLIPDGNRPSRLQTNPNAPSGSKMWKPFKNPFPVGGEGVSFSVSINFPVLLPACHSLYGLAWILQ